MIAANKNAKKVNKLNFFIIVDFSLVMTIIKILLNVKRLNFSIENQNYMSWLHYKKPTVKN
jgi:hypothetical protein